jgi:hypothetical protein
MENSCITCSIWYNSFPAVCSLGIVNNILAFVVWIRPTMLKMPVAPYFIALSVMDFMTNICAFVEWASLYILQHHRHSVLCKILYFVYYTVCEASVNILVCVSIERYIFIRFPIRSVQWVKKKFWRWTIPGVVGFLIVINAPYLYTMESALIDENTWECKNVHWTFFSNVVLQYVETVIYVFFPAVALFITNILFIDQLCKISKTRQNTLNRNQDTNIQMIVSILSVTITFVALILPYAIAIIVEDRSDLIDDGTPTSLLYQASYILALMNHIVNFFLYIMTTPVFRKELSAILRDLGRWLKCKCRESEYRETSRDSSNPTIETIA